MSNVVLQGFRSLDHGELRWVMRDLSNSEALVVDGLPLRVVKYSSLITWLCVFINAASATSTYPVLAVLLVPLHKGKVENPAITVLGGGDILFHSFCNNI